MLVGEEQQHYVFSVRKAAVFGFLTQQRVQRVSCSSAVGLGGHQRAKGDFSKPLQDGGDPAGSHKQCEHGRIQLGGLILSLL